MTLKQRIWSRRIAFGLLLLALASFVRAFAQAPDVDPSYVLLDGSGEVHGYT